MWVVNVWLIPDLLNKGSVCMLMNQQISLFLSLMFFGLFGAEMDCKVHLLKYCT